MSEPLVATDALDRRSYIGGSAIASILGLQPKGWRTAVQLWQRMTAEEPEEETPKAIRKRLARGTIVEPLVAQMLATMHGIDPGSIKRVSNRRFVDPDVPHFAAEIDFEIPFGQVKHLFHYNDAEPLAADDYPVNVEIKTVHPFAADEWGEEGTDEVPIHYAAQVYWGLGVTRRRLALCAALFGADDLILYPMEGDAATIEGMRAKATEFWMHVVSHWPPEPQTIGDTLCLWPADNGSATQATEDIAAAVTTLRRLTANRKGYSDGEEGVALFIRDFMKDATTLEQDGVELATLKSQRTSSIDAELLKAKFPDAFKACQRVGTTRVLRLKGST